MPKLKFEYKVTVAYIFIGGIWILFSDKILYFFIQDSYLLTKLQSYKGWFFVITSSILLFLFLKNHLIKLRNTEQKLLQKNQELIVSKEQIRIVNEKLIAAASTMEETNLELIIAKRKSEEGDKLKSAFLANMSHEIRTPLNGINGFVELLKNPDIKEDSRNTYINIIQSSSTQLLSIIDDIMDISKIESGQIVLHKSNTSINNILSEQYAFFTKQGNSKNLKLSHKLGLQEEQSVIFCDEKKIIQVLSNLINNALKFTVAGNIEFGYQLKGKFLEFFVKDTGIGISKENYDKIFHRFRQVENGRSRIYGGNGLGLSITKALVNKMGGKIWVESKLGGGSIFYFTIPYKPFLTINEKATGIGNQIVTRPNWSDKTILIAEDEDSNYLLIEELLSITNVRLLHAKNGKEAIDYCKTNNQINLILMDMKMPIMDGYEATKSIKQIRPNMPILAQSAHVMPEDKARSISAGCIDYITKPINGQKLLNKIKNYV